MAQQVAADAAEVESAGELTEEQQFIQMQRQAMMEQQQRAMQPWRPTCVPCFNRHKIALNALQRELQARGLTPGTQEYVVTMMQTVNERAQTEPGFRQPNPADTLVNGNAVCFMCFQTQEDMPRLVAANDFTLAQMRQAGMLNAQAPGRVRVR